MFFNIRYTSPSSQWHLSVNDTTVFISLSRYCRKQSELTTIISLFNFPFSNCFLMLSLSISKFPLDHLIILSISNTPSNLPAFSLVHPLHIQDVKIDSLLFKFIYQEI